MAFKRPSVQFCPAPPEFHEGSYVKVRAFFVFRAFTLTTAPKDTIQDLLNGFFYPSGANMKRLPWHGDAHGPYGVQKRDFRSILGSSPCLFLGLGAIDIGFGKPLREFTGSMLPFSVLVALLLFSQIPYLRKLHATQRSGLQKIRGMGGKGFQKTNFANGASFSDEDLSALYNAWHAYSMSFAAFYIPCFAVALLVGQLLSRSIGGFAGNISAVALLFAAPVLAFIMIRPRKKRYFAYRDKLGLTEKDIRQALVHKKRGTVAVGSSVASKEENE